MKFCFVLSIMLYIPWFPFPLKLYKFPLNICIVWCLFSCLPTRVDNYCSGTIRKKPLPSICCFVHKVSLSYGVVTNIVAYLYKVEWSWLSKLSTEQHVKFLGSCQRSVQIFENFPHWFPEGLHQYVEQMRCFSFSITVSQS